MKILFVLHYPPPVHGSAVMGGYLKESHLINGSFNCRYINLGLSDSVDEIGSSGIKKAYKYFGIIFKVVRSLIFNRPDLCYFTISAYRKGFYKDSLIVLLAKIAGVKTIFHFHNKGISRGKKRKFENYFYQLIFRNTDVILLSDLLYHDVQKYVPATRVHFCTNGIPKLPIIDIRHVGKASVEKPCNLLFISNLNGSKGVFNLLDACRYLKETGASFNCTLIGGDGDVNRSQLISMIAERALEKYVSYEGKKTGKAKHEALMKADIFVHPTNEDCMPLVLLEAMQYALPVISTVEGAIPDVVEEGVTGLLVPVKDAKALADKLQTLIQNPDIRYRLGLAGRQKYEQEFTLEKFERRMVEILTKVGEKL